MNVIEFSAIWPEIENQNGFSSGGIKDPQSYWISSCRGHSSQNQKCQDRGGSKKFMAMHPIAVEWMQSRQKCWTKLPIKQQTEA